MKKIIILFLILFSSELISQTWELMYKEDYLYHDSTANEHTNFCTGLVIRNDSIIILRENGSSSLFLIFNYSNKNWSFVTKDDIWKRFKNDSLYNMYKDNSLRNVIYDLNGNMWCKSILKIMQDTIMIYDKIYNRNQDKYYEISDASNLINDKNNNIWAIISNRDSETKKNCKNICILIDGVFESVYCIEQKYIKEAGMDLAVDNLNRVWCSIIDSVYLIENEVITKKLYSFDFPNGFGYFNRMVIDSKNRVYLLNHTCTMYVIDGDSLYSYDYIWEREKIDFAGGNLSNYKMCIDSSDNVWVTGISTCNLYKFDSEKNWFRYDVPQFTTMPDEWCYKLAIEADKNGKLWIPASNGYGYGFGIYVFNPNPTSVEKEQPTIQANGLPDVWIRKLYPNPADNLVTLEFFLNKKEIGSFEMTLYNVLGMKIKDIKEEVDYNSSNMSSKVTFSVAGLPRGGYIVAMKAGSTKQCRLLLVGF